MPRSVLCHICGDRVEAPPDHKRNKMRCPNCGVICELPPEENPATDRPATFSASMAPYSQDVDIRAEDFLLTSESSPTTAASVGQSLPTQTEAPLERPEDRPVFLDDDEIDDEESAPYQVAEPERRCPSCNAPTELTAKICIRCGMDMDTGKKVPKSYDPINRSWESGWSLRKRVSVFCIVQGIVFVVFTLVSIVSGNWLGLVCTWTFSSALLLFLLGTYDRTELRRTKKGRVTLTKSWRVFFYPLETKRIPLGNYESVATGKDRNNGCSDWLILLMLFAGGLASNLFLLPSVFRGDSFLVSLALFILNIMVAIIPAVFWWFMVIQREMFYVALCKDHGFPELMLYRGWNQEKMHDMAANVRNALLMMEKIED